MSATDEFFIGRAHRPDLRAAMGEVGDDETDVDWRVISSPVEFVPRMKDCSGDKSDKSDKKKEIGKDDKSPARNAAGAPSGPVTDNLHRLGADGGLGLRDAIDQSVFV